jgi:hypothetical protein
VRLLLAEAAGRDEQGQRKDATAHALTLPPKDLERIAAAGPEWGPILAAAVQESPHSWGEAAKHNRFMPEFVETLPNN